MFKRLRREASFIASNLPIIGLFAFICALGGILLWVNGGGTWYFVQLSKRGGFSMGLSGIFLLCLLSYALIGAAMAVVLKVDSSFCKHQKNTIFAFTCLAAVYILSLVWYAVFFCTRLVLFPAILLIISVALAALALILLRRSLIILNLMIILTVAAQVYFLYLNLGI